MPLVTPRVMPRVMPLVTPLGEHRRLPVTAVHVPLTHPPQPGTPADDQPWGTAAGAPPSDAHDLSASALAQHVPALDGVRGIAILLVMAFHVWRSPATALGWSGVDLFFVLSGFLITGIVYDTRHVANRARSFYVRRALRILPLYYAVLMAVLIVRPALGWAHRLDDALLAGEHVWYWTYLCDWRIALHHPAGATFLTHLWSLSIEEQFYLVWPVIVWRLSRRAALGAAVGVAVGALALRVIVVTMTSMPDAAYALLPCRLDALAVGAILALVMRGPMDVASIRAWVTPAAVSGGAVIAALAIVRPSVRFVDPAMLTVGYTALDWAFAGLVLRAATVPSALLEMLPLRAAGKYSYGLYVYHPLVMWWIVRHAPWLERSEWRFALGAVAGSVIVSWLSYQLLEGPLLRLKDRLAPRLTTT